MQVFWQLIRANWALPAVLGVCVVLIMLGGESMAQWLRYDRLAISHGEFWRLLTAHLTHLGWSHLMLNLAGFFLLWALVGNVLTCLGCVLLIFVDALAISAGLWLFDPQLFWYVGLSGVLHGVLLGGALLLTLTGRREGIALVLITVGKLLWEQLVGPMPGSEATAGGRVIVNAHLYGAIVGVLFVLLLWYQRSWRRRFVSSAS